MKNKKYPEIEPKIRKNKLGKPVEVYLDIDVYKSIFEEITDLENKIKKLKTVKKSKSTKKD